MNNWAEVLNYKPKKEPLPKSEYLDFVSNRKLKDSNFDNEDILVYTKKTKKRLFVGFIRTTSAYEMWGESKFVIKDGMVLGKYCLLALSEYMNVLDENHNMFKGVEK